MQILEINVVSIEGLGKYSPSCFNRIRPFITLTKLPTQVVYHQYDGGGGGTPEHVFRVPVDPTFFTERYSCLHLQLYKKRWIVGPYRLGWCLIPPSDIGLCDVSTLSYRLRAINGSNSHVIINLSITSRLQQQQQQKGSSSCSFLPWTTSPTVATCQTVIGIPL